MFILPFEIFCNPLQHYQFLIVIPDFSIRTPLVFIQFRIPFLHPSGHLGQPTNRSALLSGICLQKIDFALKHHTVCPQFFRFKPNGIDVTANIFICADIFHSHRR